MAAIEEETLIQQENVVEETQESVVEELEQQDVSTSAGVADHDDTPISNNKEDADELKKDDGQSSSDNSGDASKEKEKRIISWEEFEQHNIASDCWLAVRGKVYDVTSWVPKHPGGTDTIVLNGGHDATQLFEAYHPLKVNAVLNKYYIGELEANPSHPTFPPMSEFYITLKQRLEEHFKRTATSPRHAPEMIVRSVGLIFAALLMHYMAIYTETLLFSMMFAALSGFFYALICFMPVHEGSHASTTSSPAAWRLMGAVHDFVNGASFYNWCHQHFLGHHPFTNLSDEDALAVDPDIYTNEPDVRRIKPHQPYHNHYKWQQFYAPLMYGLLGLKFRITDVIIIFFTQKNGSVRVNPPDSWHLFAFWVGKCFFLFYRIIYPALETSLAKSLMMFIISDLLTSYMLAFVFQVNHVIPQAKWPIMDKKTGKVNMDWAEMQLRTTMDYAHGSWLTTFCTGALNYQVTHHLVPYISQIHYPEIAPIIKDHCKKYDLPYNHVPTFTEALKYHFEWLRVMGHAHSDY